MRNKPYVKIAFNTEYSLLSKAVQVAQNLPAHCIASVRQSTHGVNIELVRNRCLKRWEEIQRMKDSASRKSIYRNSVPDTNLLRDLEVGLEIVQGVYIWLSNWDAKVTSGGIDKVYQDPVFVSYHEVTLNENRAPDSVEERGSVDLNEGTFGADNSYNEEWN